MKLSAWRMSSGPMVLAAVTALSLAAVRGQEKEGPAAQDETPQLVYELRTYTTAEGRLPALHKRFRDHTLRLFEKHGMKNVIYWEPVDKENTLVYVIAHKSRADAKKSWDAFRSDPEWQKAYKESHKDGKIVVKVESQYLKATDYSPMK